MSDDAMDESSSYKVWVYLKVEVATDGSLEGHYWFIKKYEFDQIPPVGLELDLRETVGSVVSMDRVLLEPNTKIYKAYQTSWFSFGVGSAALWEREGWAKRAMTDEEVQESK